MLTVKVTTKEKNFVEMADGRYTPYQVIAPMTEEETTIQVILENIRQYLIWTAKDALAQELKLGFDPYYITRVDGQNNKRIEDVKPLGKIQYFARQDILEAAIQTYLMIQMFSKVESGDYQKANMVFFNSIMIADNMVDLRKNLSSILQSRTLTKDDTLRFINIAAYARRLETLGITAFSIGSGNKRWHMSKPTKRRSARFLKPPNGTYWQVAKLVQKRYAVLSGNKFKFELLTGNYLGIGNLSLSRGFKRATFSRGRGIGRPYLYPTIVLRLGAEGYTQ